MNIRAYEEGFGSVERVAIATAADPLRQLRAVEMLVCELATGVAKGELAVTDWADRVQKIAEKTGMIGVHGQDRIQSMMSRAMRGAVSRPTIESSADANPPAERANEWPQQRNRATAELVVRRASEIEPEALKWLWPHRIALGKQTIIAGETGLGKSQLTYAITATTTTGGRWPGDEGSAPPGSVIILSAEDDAADTIRPRLDAAGADVSKVYILSAVQVEDGKGRRSFNIQTDLEPLEREIERRGDVRLVVIDPVSSYLGKVDSHRNAELRAVLEPLSDMAARLGVAVLSVTHLSKGSGGAANSRFIGSIAFVATARADYIVARDPNDGERRLFLPTKNNLGPEGTGLGFRIATKVTPSGIVAPAVCWDSLPVTVTANEVVNGSSALADRDAPARDEAKRFLRTILAGGLLPVRQIESEAKSAGIAWRTIRRAKNEMGVTATKTALDGGWCWALPKGGHP
jgi:hypothetical protein